MDGDMWNHQYLQQCNAINAEALSEYVWATDGPDAIMYGLAPNYGCCTANFNQVHTGMHMSRAIRKWAYLLARVNCI